VAVLPGDDEDRHRTTCTSYRRSLRLQGEL